MKISCAKYLSSRIKFQSSTSCKFFVTTLVILISGFSLTKTRNDASNDWCNGDDKIPSLHELSIITILFLDEVVWICCSIL